jgi:hypothetical protein
MVDPNDPKFLQLSTTKSNRSSNVRECVMLRGLPQKRLQVTDGAEFMLVNEMRGNGPDSYQRM